MTRQRGKYAKWVRLKIIFAALLFGMVFCMSGTWSFADDVNNLEAFTLTVDIDSPPDFVYLYLSEEDKIALWSKDDSAVVTFPKGTETRVGKQIRVTMKLPTHPWFLMEIRRLTPGKEICTEFIDGFLQGDFAYKLTPLPNGRTRFVHIMRIDPKGSLIRVIWVIYGKRLHHHKMQHLMDQAKKVIEADYLALQENREER